jgi:hypothetical protein
MKWETFSALDQIFELGPEQAPHFVLTMTLPHLPVETWCQVLEECISVPTFLDPEHLFEVKNPIYNNQSDHSEKKYWAAERQRNVLQRVCKAWDGHLAPFKHRFVRIQDVYHGIVPKKASSTAIRIFFGHCPDYHCDQCPQRRDLDAHNWLFVDGNELSVKIMDGTVYYSLVIGNTIIKYYGKMPQLAAILKAVFRKDEFQDWADAMSSLPKLLYVQFATSHNGQTIQLQAANLRYLTYANEAAPLMLRADLPSLRHLTFIFQEMSSIEPTNLKDLVHTLGGIGQNLVSLQVGIGFDRELILPKEVLEICCRLERLDTVLCLRHPPPPGHPLRTVHLPLPFYERNTGNSVAVSPFPPSIDGWQSMETFIVDVDWRNLKGFHAPFFPLVRDWEKACQQNGVLLQDRCGISLKDSDWRLKKRAYGAN